jgi:hypothetical protein
VTFEVVGMGGGERPRMMACMHHSVNVLVTTTRRAVTGIEYAHRMLAHAQHDARQVIWSASRLVHACPDLGTVHRREL